ncbi:hypothetical protein O9993_00715 [Vibrio lentus]|nr:hypothetical protein [Vibrio lentus]
MYDFNEETIETHRVTATLVTTQQTIAIQVLPVDDITAATDSTTIQEDIATDLNLGNPRSWRT